MNKIGAFLVSGSVDGNVLKLRAGDFVRKAGEIEPFDFTGVLAKTALWVKLEDAKVTRPGCRIAWLEATEKPMPE